MELLVSVLGWSSGGVGGTAWMTRFPCCVFLSVLLVVWVALDRGLLQQVLGIQNNPNVFGEGDPKVLPQLLLPS